MFGNAGVSSQSQQQQQQQRRAGGGAGGGATAGPISAAALQQALASMVGSRVSRNLLLCLVCMVYFSPPCRMREGRQMVRQGDRVQGEGLSQTELDTSHRYREFQIICKIYVFLWPYMYI